MSYSNICRSTALVVADELNGMKKLDFTFLFLYFLYTALLFQTKAYKSLCQDLFRPFAQNIDVTRFVHVDTGVKTHNKLKLLFIKKSGTK